MATLKIWLLLWLMGNLGSFEKRNDKILLLKEIGMAIVLRTGYKGVRETREKAISVFQVRDNRAFDYVGISGSSEKWIDSEYFFNV